MNADHPECDLTSSSQRKFAQGTWIVREIKFDVYSGNNERKDKAPIRMPVEAR